MGGAARPFPPLESPDPPACDQHRPELNRLPISQYHGEEEQYLCLLSQHSLDRSLGDGEYESGDRRCRCLDQLGEETAAVRGCA